MKNQESETIELNNRAKKRFQRFADFEEFYSKAKVLFEPFKQLGEREQYFNAVYNLCVVPGSRAGACDSNCVDIFWGNRLFDKEKGLENGHLRFGFKLEEGTTLFIRKNDDGYVTILLYPAHTEATRPIEDFIIWKYKIDPSKLLSKCFQRKCWQVFMAYMEVTSLDGDPSMGQRLHIWYLRNFKQQVLNGKTETVKFCSFLRKFGTWFVTVAFSGLAIFLLQMWLQPNPAEHKNVETIKETSIESHYLLEDMQKELIRIGNNQDSLMNHIRKQKVQ